MPRSAGHRPGRTAMAAGGRAGRAQGPVGGRAAFSASAQSPSLGRPRGPCQRTALPPGGGLRGARGAWLPWAPGAQQCSRGGAQRQPRRAPSQPPRGARSRVAGRRAPQNTDWSNGAGRRQGGAGEGRRGPAARCLTRGRPPAPGIPPGDARSSPREGLGWWAGRPPTAPRGLQGPGQESETRSGSVLGSGLSQDPVCAQVAREGSRLRRPRRGASLQKATPGRGARGRFRCSPLPAPHPTPRLRAALRGRQRAAVRH